MADIAPWEAFWRSHVTNLHTDFDFYGLICRSRPEVKSPFVLAAVDSNGPRALLVGRLEDAPVQVKLGFVSLGSLRARQCVFVPEGILGDQSPEIAALFLDAVRPALIREGAQLAIFSNLEDDSPLLSQHAYLPALWRGFVRETNEHWRAALPESLDLFLQARSKKHRYWLKRIGKVLEKTFPGEVRYVQYQQPSEVEQFCRAADRATEGTYQRGLGVGFIDNAENRGLVQLGAQQGWWTAYVIEISGQPIAFWSGMLHRGVYHVVWTSYQPAYAQYEPGSIGFLKMVEHLCQMKVLQMDFGIGSAFYKQRFGDKLIVETSLRVYAPGLRPFWLNLCYSGGIWMDRLMHQVLNRLNLTDRIKRVLRQRAAAKSGKPSDSAGAEPGSET